ncbi:hypothetical protein Hanom_Chr09g00822821 [Helianthus anomalus]
MFMASLMNMIFHEHGLSFGHCNMKCCFTLFFSSHVFDALESGKQIFKGYLLLLYFYHNRFTFVFKVVSDLEVTTYQCKWPL